MTRYETVFILTPVLSEEQAAETVDKFKALVAEHGGKVNHTENWGLRKLAYPIQKKTTGFYYLLEFDAEGTVVQPMEIAFQRDERVIRWLTSRMDKHHETYAEKRKVKIKNQKNAPAESAE